MTDFVHLHTHSDFSLLDGAAPIPRLVARAKELGMRHLALTDHGNMFGALKFYLECKANDINPILGSEFYVASASRHIKSGSENGNRYSHLILLAMNSEGYKNLIQLSSLSYTEGFYYKPRIDFELLEAHSGGLICLSACLGGEIPFLLRNDNYAAAKERAGYYRDLFGEGRYYLELQDHGLPDQKKINPLLLQLSKETGIPLVAANDIHYISQEDANAQDILICIGTNRKKHELERMKFPSDQFYMKSGNEMAALFPYAPEAIENSVRIAQMCRIEIELPGPLLPNYAIPEGYRSPEEYLRSLTMEGLSARYPVITEEIRGRTEFELDVITSMGFTGYFLIVWDFIHWAKVHEIPVGPGRGSGAGSIVAYALTITDIDPLKYDLLFERFLNPDRISMPDFDIDFCFERRQEVIDYVTAKYGKDRVGQIITFGTLKAKAVVKDVARVLDISFAESNEITKLIPSDPKMTLEKAFAQEPRLAEMEQKGGVYAELFDVSRRLEGLNRHCSTHAAGIVIGHDALTEYVPLYREPNTGAVSTQYTMDLLENCGLVKMDFLGLKTLTQISNAVKLIRKRGIDFDISAIPDNDPATFALLGEGRSASIFQFESSGMQGILKTAKPGSIEDLIALNALYRPGPMANIPQFIECKNGRTAIRYPHPDLEETLKPTYGVIVYQEQVMKVGQIIGGFSLGKADIMRRAMGKKKIREMETLKAEFIDGALKKGYSEQFARDIFDMLAPFAGYGFNKSHAAAYSVIAYQTAYLKANYPLEFMAATLTNEINSTDKLAQYISEVTAMGIEILPPDINLSERVFGVADGKISYGLVAIKNVGSGVVSRIIEEREKQGPYSSFIDFLNRIDARSANRKTLESLIKAGTFDRMGVNRATLLLNLENLTEYVSRRKEAEQFGQVSLFDMQEEQELGNFEMQPVEEISNAQKLEYERELLGFYFSGHPLEDYREIWKRCVRVDLSRPDRFIGGNSCNLLGIVTARRTIVTRKGEPMAFVTIEDFQGSTELIFFPKVWVEHRHLVEVDRILGFTGKFDLTKQEEPKFLVDSVVEPGQLSSEGVSGIHIRIAAQMAEKTALSTLRDQLLDIPGSCSVYLHVAEESSPQETVIKVSDQLRVAFSEKFVDSIKNNPLVREVWPS
jgi:DNA polymerase III subunit alpha